MTFKSRGIHGDDHIQSFNIEFGRIYICNLILGGNPALVPAIQTIACDHGNQADRSDQDHMKI